MKKVLFASFLLTISINLFAQNNEIKFSGWKKAETEHFNFIYEEAQREATEGFILYADEAWNNIAKIYGIPQNKTNVYVTGRTNTVNAFTYFSPTEIVMFTNPCAMTDFTFRDNWQKLFFTHELVHVANARFEDKDQTLSKLFGPFVVSLDLGNINGWALEGLTTVMETELLNGGRGRSPYFELNYKAPTLDNGFMSYDEIGMEQEPPYGQSYVMGYLIMRSIADRFGLDALADIERNRDYFGSWEDSVKLVTGQTAQDIYRDVRISLAKKYAGERNIPEGLIISPREINTNYYKPAIVFDDGTLIAIRSAPGQANAVVRLDPSAKAGRNWIEDTNPEEDLNTIFKETILFTAAFIDSDSVTADENGNIYATLADQRYDRAPGIELEAALYSWSKENGKKQLTKDVSLFMPSVSRNGKVLIAVQQKGMQYSLVKIDPQTGAINPLLESKELSFISPSVNSDGTKVAFLVLDDSRAKVAVMDLENPNSYEIVANDDEQIFDPSYPNWNKDGTLSYCCNYRGRLEIFEAVKNDEDGSWCSNAMLSDPIGATWSYKNDLGVFYTSQASSGKVIKIKPLSEWGNPVDFEGPSKPGEIICFGHLQNDFPEFKPYTILSEVEIPAEKDDKSNIKKANLKKTDAKQEIEKPIPIKGKTVKHRSEKNKKIAEEANSKITKLENETNYIPKIQPLFYTPFISFFDDSITDKLFFGYGGALLAQTPKLQMAPGYLLCDFFYFPKLKNFEGSIDFFIPVRNFQIDFISAHNMTMEKENDTNYYNDHSLIELGITVPFINVYKQNYDALLEVFAASCFELNRYSTNSLSINNKNYDNRPSLFAYVGSESYFKKYGTKESYTIFDASVTGIGMYDFDVNKIKLGIEGDASAKRNFGAFEIGALIKTRYTPFSANTKVTNTNITYGGKKYDCTYPGMLIPQLNMSVDSALLPGIQYKIYSEFLAQFGNKNLPKESFFNKDMMLGLEAVLAQNQLEACIGISYRYDFLSLKSDEDQFKFYFRFKYDWMKN